MARGGAGFVVDHRVRWPLSIGGRDSAPFSAKDSKRNKQSSTMKVGYFLLGMVALFARPGDVSYNLKEKNVKSGERRNDLPVAHPHLE